MEYGNGAQRGHEPNLVFGPLKRTLDLDHVTASLDAVDMGEFADVTANLRSEIRLDIFGPSLLEQGVGVVFVGNNEYKLIDDLRTPSVCWAAL